MTPRAPSLNTQHHCYHLSSELEGSICIRRRSEAGKSAATNFLVQTNTRGNQPMLGTQKRDIMGGNPCGYLGGKTAHFGSTLEFYLGWTSMAWHYLLRFGWIWNDNMYSLYSQDKNTNISSTVSKKAIFCDILAGSRHHQRLHTHTLESKTTTHSQQNTSNRRPSATHAW